MTTEPRRRRWGRIVAGLTGLVLVVFLLTPTGCYLSRAGWEEAKILAGRRRIVRLVEDPTTDAPTRARLRLVHEVLPQTRSSSVRATASRPTLTSSAIRSSS
jgi:hypothetical protein